jgi:hypothetical protein
MADILSPAHLKSVSMQMMTKAQKSTLDALVATMADLDVNCT